MVVGQGVVIGLSSGVNEGAVWFALSISPGLKTMMSFVSSMP